MPNLATPLWENAERRAQQVAVGDNVWHWNYLELRGEIARFASDLDRAGVEVDDRVLLVAPSVPEFVVAYYGLHAVGAVAITMNVMATVPEIDYVLRDSGASAVIAWHENAEAAAQAAAAHGVAFTVLSETQPSGDPVQDWELVERSADDTAVILYTSGTTGRPKGAELTVGNIASCADAFRQVLQLQPDDRWATGLPLFHVYGQAVVMHTALTAGCSLTLQKPFEPSGFIEILRDQKITIACGVPTMWNAMLHVAGAFSPQDFASLRLCASGGASLPADVMRAFTERFSCVILEGYGLTETTGAATFNGLDRDRKPGFVGIALPGSEISIRDGDGEPVPIGEVGEVFLKGPSVMKGYWKRPEVTAAELQDGWLRTGDLGSLDEVGDLRIVDRAKDLIIRGGYNVYPREVEEVLYEHPDIVEVAVIGLPDDHFGEEVAAVIALRPGANLLPEDIRAWAKGQLSAYKVPRVFQFVDELPKGATGKILKRSINRNEISRQVKTGSSS